VDEFVEAILNAWATPRTLSGLNATFLVDRTPPSFPAIFLNLILPRNMKSAAVVVLEAGPGKARFAQFLLNAE
jgi:hypothetical protein